MSAPECQKKIPVGWEKVVPCFNHSELWFASDMATAVGCCKPFPCAERLPEDNGERFFSEHMSIVMPSLQGARSGNVGECMCALCRKTSTKTVAFSSPSPAKTPTTTTTTTTMEVEILTDNDKAASTPTTTTQRCQTINNVNSAVTRPRASLPWQAANQVTSGARNSASRNLFGARAVAGAPAVAPMPIAPLIPMRFQLPFCCNCVAQNAGPCCQKRAEWLLMRRGRPPHHPLCQNR